MAFIDEFTGSAADTFLQDHTPTGGTAWTLINTTGRQFAISADADGVTTLYSGSGPTITPAISCDDQGSADHAMIAKWSALTGSYSNAYAVVRYVDVDNWVGVRLFGTGASGRRLSKAVAGTITDLITAQGVANEWVKVEAEGDKYRLYQGGTGATPVWVQTGSEQTIPNSEISISETRQGLRSTTTAGPVADEWITYFEAVALGGGGGFQAAWARGSNQIIGGGNP